MDLGSQEKLVLGMANSMHFSILQVLGDQREGVLKRRDELDLGSKEKLALGMANLMHLSILQVLSDERKREVYDIYGLEGLRAGMEVELRSRTRQDLKEAWDQFLRAQVPAHPSRFFPCTLPRGGSPHGERALPL